MRVQRLQPHAVVEDHAVAVDPEPTGVHDAAAVRRANRARAAVDAKIEAEMHLVVDVGAVVDVRALIGEARFDGRVDELLERAAPEDLGRRAEREVRDRLVVHAAQLAIDREIRRQEVARIVDLELGRVLQDRRHDACEEPVVEIDRARAELLREHAEVEAAAAFVADGVAREHRDRRVQVLVPEQREERDAQRRIGCRRPGSRDTRDRRRARPTRRRAGSRDRRPSRSRRG